VRKYVYSFGGGKADGDATMKQLLGGKGANLAEMTNIGLPVPPGFTISAEVCDHYNKNGGKYPEGMQEQVEQALKKLEAEMGRDLGDKNTPLLVSVRSGAAISMPGMMDTVLNLGLNDETVQGLVRETGNERFGWDCYRRLLNMFGNVVMGVPHEAFEEVLTRKKKEVGADLDTDLSAEELKDLVDSFKAVYRKEVGEDFPQEPRNQLELGIEAVFKSWNIPRAVTYRQINNITGLLGTAVNVQTMVFGNTGGESGTGVCFTRNPATGENVFYGEFLMNAQGEDVVAGIRTPQAIDEMKKIDPGLYDELVEIRHTLEQHYRDIQDIEFTVEGGKLYILQTRTGKRTAPAAVKIAADMVKEGLIDKKTAVTRVEPEQVDRLLHPMFDPKADRHAIAKGLPASPGAAVGKVALTAAEAVEMAQAGEPAILTRVETSPEDIAGMDAAEGILTQVGGMTSHAAIVARGMGKCCVVGCGGIAIDYSAGQFTTQDGTTVKKGDWLSIDGSSGEVMLGRVKTVEPELAGEFVQFMEYVDEVRKLGVRANADTPRDARNAREFGAEGIGLCRTEHMFFEGERIVAMREMILAADERGRKKALDKLLPIQRGDFVGIFREMEGLPVTIRLLDPPLHEFLPKEEKNQQEMAEAMGVPAREIKEKVDSLHELNPMLGLRGCRLGITYPEVTDMQVRAILEAACELEKEGKKVLPEIMVPLIGTAEELELLHGRIDKVAKEVFAAQGVEVKYLVGTMIEIPRAALTADKVAETAEFFSFGTNDLTQMTFGYSRDDAGTFLPTYLDQKILKADPFQVLDQEGVGQLVEMGITKGRSTRSNLKVGICGEHGGEPSSVKFCHRVGMNYVSCSPFRVPIARLAAAHAVAEEEGN